MRNERENRLIEFADYEQMHIINSFFKKKTHKGNGHSVLQMPQPVNPTTSWQRKKLLKEKKNFI